MKKTFKELKDSGYIPFDDSYSYKDYELNNDQDYVPDNKLNDYTYLNLLDKIYTRGDIQEQRASLSSGVKPQVKSIFGLQARFDVSKYFPLLTTKKMYWKGIVHELLWFLKGDTNIKYLVENDVNIWNDDCYKRYSKYYDTVDAFAVPKESKLSKEIFIDCIKNDKEFARRYGDLGPIYGKSWRDHHGYDQVKNLIEEIKEVKENPHCPCARRLIIDGWNPSRTKEMALPPCHLLYQFKVNKDKLSLQMYQRSCDTVLGVPFNIASSSLLLYLVAKTCDLQPSEFIHTYGDVHIYDNHYSVVEEQLSSPIHESPSLEIINKKDNLWDYTFEDIVLKDYKYSTLKEKAELAT